MNCCVRSMWSEEKEERQHRFKAALTSISHAVPEPVQDRSLDRLTWERNLSHREALLDRSSATLHLYGCCQLMAQIDCLLHPSKYDRSNDRSANSNVQRRSIVVESHEKKKNASNANCHFVSLPSSPSLPSNCCCSAFTPPNSLDLLSSCDTSCDTSCDG